MKKLLFITWSKLRFDLFLFFPLVTVTFLVQAGCGKQAFVVTESTQKIQAPGNFIVPAKVDLLLVEDDTGSRFEVYEQIAKQFPSFLSGLQSKGWDYHFSTIPLITDRLMNQIMASKHDGNWGSQWQPPYPGAAPSGPGTVVPEFFRLPEQYTGFITRTDVNNNAQGSEPGLKIIRNALYERSAGTGFLRSDALLVIFLIANGEDTSYVNYCNRGDHFLVPCEQAGQPLCKTKEEATAPGSQCGSLAMSFDYFKSQFRALKTNPDQVKFFSAVAHHSVSDCLGGRSYVGSRYIQLSKELGSDSFDVCSQSISKVLDSLADRLQGIKIAFRTRYLLIEKEPDLKSIQVTRYLGGDPNRAVVISQDAQNGWTYAGKLTDVYMIDAPIAMNLVSGYAIELHGSAKLTGDDTAVVGFKPNGSRDSAR